MMNPNHLQVVLLDIVILERDPQWTDSWDGEGLPAHWEDLTDDTMKVYIDSVIHRTTDSVTGVQ